ncbi:MAG: thiosulfate oxidation carrier complex protein SoxZ [Pseudomonadota bacterium]|jgi:sulfur-oxidizing protein SoxZ
MATGDVTGASARTLIKAPARARRGEVMALSALIGHVMETGFRPDGNGRNVPRNILRRFVCRYNGVEVFAADLNPAISANPYLAFHTVATESGTLSFHWHGDHGFEHSVSRSIEVVDGG